MIVVNGVLTKTVFFKNGKGFQYKLYPPTYKHIRIQHPEVKEPLKFIKSVFDDTFAIFENKKHRDMYLYYSLHRSLYKVVVVNTVDRVIKTAFISDKIKEGDMLWLNKNQLLN